MLLIGERINTSRKVIDEAVRKKDSEAILKEAVLQVDAGVDMLDVNCGVDPEKETENMEWLVRIIQEKVNVPLVIDSPAPDVIERGLRIHRGKAIINSITAQMDKEKSRTEKIIEFVNKYNASLIILTMDDKGMPETAIDRIKIVEKMVKILSDCKIKLEDCYFDLLVRPLSVEQKQALEFLNALNIFKKNFQKIKTVCGLSNISYGLPKRTLINSTFLAMCIYEGLDAVMIDPLDKNMIAVLRASEVILNRDEYCIRYITAQKEGKF